MAKKQEPEETPKPLEAPEAPPVVPPATPVAVSPGKFRVSVNCPTPLMTNPLEVEAANEADAKAKFCEVNGIRGSDHAWTITALK